VFCGEVASCGHNIKLKLKEETDGGDWGLIGGRQCGGESRVEWGADPGPCTPDAPRLYERALCAPLLVSPVISRGAPRPAT